MGYAIWQIIFSVSAILIILIWRFFRGRFFVLKAVLTLPIAAVFILSGLITFSTFLESKSDRLIIWGLTFSSEASKGINTDWKASYTAVLDELKPAKIRLAAYWNKIEGKKGEYNFSDLDWQVKEAEVRNAKLIISVGMKVPRWPECHIPDWAKQLSTEKRETALREYMKAVIERYEWYPNLEAWQIENEPFLMFGICPERENDFLDKEISLAKSIDKKHQVITTDGGEFGLWYKAAKKGDIFGSTMYRRVYNRVLGFIDYSLPPGFFILKEKIVKLLIGDRNKKFIVAELAAEPWMLKQITETSPEEQFKYFDYDFFKDTISYAKKTDFSEFYFWGAEWWYYLKTKGYPEIWNEAEKIMASK